MWSLRVFPAKAGNTKAKKIVSDPKKIQIFCSFGKPLQALLYDQFCGEINPLKGVSVLGRGTAVGTGQGVFLGLWENVIFNFMMSVGGCVGVLFLFYFFTFVLYKGVPTCHYGSSYVACVSFSVFSCCEGCQCLQCVCLPVSAAACCQLGALNTFLLNLYFWKKKRTKWEEENSFGVDKKYAQKTSNLYKHISFAILENSQKTSIINYQLSLSIPQERKNDLVYIYRALNFKR